MRFDADKDLYSILGVPPNASREVIGQAWKKKVQIIHPDRFDRVEQKPQWDYANELLADLNVAFQTLNDTKLRAQYDEFKGHRRATPQPAPNRTAPSGNPFSPAPQGVRNYCEFVEAEFRDLPEFAKKELKERQKRSDLEQFRCMKGSWLPGLIMIPFSVLLIWGFAALTNEPPWATEWFMYLGLSTAACFFGVFGVYRLARHLKSEVRPAFYITPQQIIITNYDYVKIWPLVDLNNMVAANDHDPQGRFIGRAISFQFSNGVETVQLDTVAEILQFQTKIKKYLSELPKNRVYNEKSTLNSKYNELASIEPDKLPFAKKPSFPILPLTLATLFLGTVVFGVGYATNQNYNKNRQIARVASPNLKRPTTAAQSATHTPRPTPVPARVEPPYPRQLRPENNEIIHPSRGTPIAPIRIDNTEGDDVFLKLVLPSTREPVISIFVRAGMIAETKVPLGTYNIYYASGEIWYGEKYLFGPDTRYSKGDEATEFYIEETPDRGKAVIGATFKLAKVRDGNFPTSDIDASEF